MSLISSVVLLNDRVASLFIPKISTNKMSIIYIKADPKVTNPKHVMSCTVLDGVSSRVHIYVKEKENHTLEVISVKPY